MTKNNQCFILSFFLLISQPLFAATTELEPEYCSAHVEHNGRTLFLIAEKLTNENRPHVENFLRVQENGLNQRIPKKGSDKKFDPTIAKDALAFIKYTTLAPGSSFWFAYVSTHPEFHPLSTLKTEGANAYTRENDIARGKIERPDGYITKHMEMFVPVLINPGAILSIAHGITQTAESFIRGTRPPRISTLLHAFHMSLAQKLLPIDYLGMVARPLNGMTKIFCTVFPLHARFGIVGAKSPIEEELLTPLKMSVEDFIRQFPPAIQDDKDSPVLKILYPDEKGRVLPKREFHDIASHATGILFGDQPPVFVPWDAVSRTHHFEWDKRLMVDKRK